MRAKMCLVEDVYLYKKMNLNLPLAHVAHVESFIYVKETHNRDSGQYNPK